MTTPPYIAQADIARRYGVTEYCECLGGPHDPRRR